MASVTSFDKLKYSIASEEQIISASATPCLQ